ncbi:MAG: 4-(cytidine 5'-diphospho)-2-C-methyl-D-erythritol kinase [Ruminococcus sp.]|nr:4-(cytidine 5'-diphospho)-2-C-methyl-D-erythritol kinase [Ruminococcus sp.]MDE7138174.1 4-(cytidine 5'-diphospho)-2-C-methyl-D-erythritol kinase [Ruminococcus sp.]
MKVKSAAKINLALDVTGRLDNGYHSIESVFQTVGIYDEVTVELTESDISISCELPENFADSDPIPCDERNIAYKTAKFFFEQHGIKSGCRIHIKKGIPSQAGMGGGSSDAAAVLYCLSKMTEKEIISPEKLGADVPFFLTGGTAYVSGIGEKITPIVDYSGKIFVIAKAKQGVSTAEAYRKIDALVNPVHPQTDKLVEAIENSPENAYKYFGNLFEDAIQLDEVNAIKSTMLECNALSSVMTGSGSAVFGLFSSLIMAEACYNQLLNSGFYVKICQSVNKSFIEME